MIRIVTTRKLAALRAEVTDLRGRFAVVRKEAATITRCTAELRRLAAAVQAEAGQAKAAYRALHDDTMACTIRLKGATRDPVHGQNVRADLALTIMRQEIASIKERGDPAETASIQVLDALLGTEADDEQYDIAAR